MQTYMASDNENRKMELHLEVQKIPDIIQAGYINEFLDTKLENMDELEIFEMGREARNLHDFSAFVIGKLALSLAKRYGENSIQRFSEEIGLKPTTVAQYRWVAKSFPELKSYSEGLSFSYYRLAAGTNNPQGWIDKAIDNNWNVTQLEKKIKGQLLASECSHKNTVVYEIHQCDDCGVVISRERVDV